MGEVLVTHAMEELAGPNLTVGQCIELADLGATIELARSPVSARSRRGARARLHAPPAGCAERCTLATDYGQKANVRPAPGFQEFADALLAEGLDDRAIRRMACDNPCALLDSRRNPPRKIPGVEDRATPFLYLEMSDVPRDDYATTRVNDVLAHAGVARDVVGERVPGSHGSSP